jgi:hypothetical protein
MCIGQNYSCEDFLNSITFYFCNFNYILIKQIITLNAGIHTEQCTIPNNLCADAHNVGAVCQVSGS